MSIIIEGKEVSIDGLTDQEVILLRSRSRSLDDHSAVCPCYDCREEMINDIMDGWED
jgi:hypothetical protein